MTKLFFYCLVLSCITSYKAYTMHTHQNDYEQIVTKIKECEANNSESCLFLKNNLPKICAGTYFAYYHEKYRKGQIPGPEIRTNAACFKLLEKLKDEKFVDNLLATSSKPNNQ